MAMDESFKTELNSFFCQHCALKHEKVRQEKNSLPVKDSVAESGYKRVGLCDIEYRKRNLSCAHTAARKHFHNLLQRISETSADKAGFDALANKVFDLDLKIVLIDVEKNNAEVEYAKVLESFHSCEKGSDLQSQIKPELSKIKTKIADIVKVHNGLVDEMQQCLSQAREKVNVAQCSG